MYMTSSLGSAWNSLRCVRPRATKAMVSGACQRMLTGLTLLRMPSETSARLTALSSVMRVLLLELDSRRFDQRRVVGDFLAQVGVEGLGRIIHRLGTERSELRPHVRRVQRLCGFLVEPVHRIARGPRRREHADPEVVIGVGNACLEGGRKIGKRERALRDLPTTLE